MRTREEVPELTVEAVAKMIDHAVLAPDHTFLDVEQACTDATQHGFAAVCLAPYAVSYASKLLRGTGVAICGTVGIPLGYSGLLAKANEARTSIEAGASEIEMVINLVAMKKRPLRRRSGRDRGPPEAHDGPGPEGHAGVLLPDGPGEGAGVQAGGRRGGRLHQDQHGVRARRRHGAGRPRAASDGRLEGRDRGGGRRHPFPAGPRPAARGGHPDRHLVRHGDHQGFL